MLLYHGSPYLFAHFSLSAAGEGTGIKFGYGVYLTESEASAAHYSQPRHTELQPRHYLYTVEVPELTASNHLLSAKAVPHDIVALVEQRLGVTAPSEAKAAGKEFRKWVGCMLTGSRKASFEEERRSAEFLDSIGVIYNVWPTAQTKPDGHRNVAVFNAANVRIVKIEEITIEQKQKRWVLLERKEISL